MKTLVTIFFALFALQGFSPEDMYGSYDRDGKYRAMEEQIEQINRQYEAAEQERSEKKMFIFYWCPIKLFRAAATNSSCQ